MSKNRYTEESILKILIYQDSIRELRAFYNSYLFHCLIEVELAIKKLKESGSLSEKELKIIRDLVEDGGELKGSGYLLIFKKIKDQLLK